MYQFDEAFERAQRANSLRVHEPKPKGERRIISEAASLAAAERRKLGANRLRMLDRFERGS